MAIKTANVMARVSPDVKSQAEFIMDQLGVPASVVINALYKQIIFTKSIPFSMSMPKEPIALDEIDANAFNKIMERGYNEAIKFETNSKMGGL